jgi:hypothetical protein
MKRSNDAVSKGLEVFIFITTVCKELYMNRKAPSPLHYSSCYELQETVNIAMIQE